MENSFLSCVTCDWQSCLIGMRLMLCLLSEWLITVTSNYRPLHPTTLALFLVHIWKKKISVPIGPHCPCARPCALYLLLHYKNRAPWFPSESKAALRTTWAASASESKSRLSHSFYWSVRSSWIISELVGFRTDTELLLKHCLLSLMLTSIIYHPAGTSHFSRRLCTATEAG